MAKAPAHWPTGMLRAMIGYCFTNPICLIIAPQRS